MKSVLVACALVLAIGIAPAAADVQADDSGEPRRRSSFWGSNKPSKHGAYRWRLLGIGVGLLGITGIVMIRLVRKARVERVESAKRVGAEPVSRS